jgi:hypothetical protein
MLEVFIEEVDLRQRTFLALLKHIKDNMLVLIQEKVRQDGAHPLHQRYVAAGGRQCVYRREAVKEKEHGA